MALRTYKVWQGHNRFFCRGALMAGPDFQCGALTFGFIFAAMIVFLVFPATDLAANHGGWVYGVSGAAAVVSLASLAVTALSDPGIIPRRVEPVDSKNGKGQKKKNDAFSFRKPMRTQQMLVDGQVFKLKYCDTCKIYRPPRCVHCAICNNCVQVYDHHCPWVGNCVGKRNYRSFTVFLHSTTFLVVFVLVMCAIHMHDAQSEKQNQDPSLTASSAWWNVVTDNPSSFLLSLLCGVFLFFVGGLCGYHMFLVCIGQTTNEQLKHLFPHGSPFSAGARRNCLQLFCTLPIASDVKLRRKVTEHGHQPTREPIVIELDNDTAAAGDSDAAATSGTHHSTRSLGGAVHANSGRRARPVRSSGRQHVTAGSGTPSSSSRSDDAAEDDGDNGGDSFDDDDSSLDE